MVYYSKTEEKIYANGWFNLFLDGVTVFLRLAIRLLFFWDDLATLTRVNLVSQC